MKNTHFTHRIFMTVLFAFVFMYAMDANASFLTSITGSLFTKILGFMGFGSSENGYCWFCPLFGTLFDTINTLATTVATNLKDVVLTMLGIGILFFIAFRVGATVVKLQEVDLMQFLGDLFKHLGRAIIAAAIIMGTTEIFDLIITPFLAYSLNLAITFMDNADLSGGLAKSKILRMAVSGITDSAESLCDGFKGSSLEGGSKIFSDDLLKAMKCMLATVSSNLILGMVVGLCVIAMGMVANWILPDPQQVISGGIIFGSFFMIYLKVPFVLIDNLIRLAFVAALMPFWVILWVFPATVQYTKNAWNMFLAACVSFISFGAVIAIVMSLLQYMCPDMSDILTSMIPGYDLIASSKASVFTKNTLLTLALGIFCRNMLGVPDEFAARITQSYGIAVGQGMEGSLTGAASRSLGILGGVSALGAGIAVASNGSMDDTTMDKFTQTAGSLRGNSDPLLSGIFSSSTPTNVKKYTDAASDSQLSSGTGTTSGTTTGGTTTTTGTTSGGTTTSGTSGSTSKN